MNIAQWDLGVYVSREDHVMDADALLVSRRLNERPVVASGKPLWPARAMRERVAKLAAGRAKNDVTTIGYNVTT
jgi:hypothetical protein